MLRGFESLHAHTTNSDGKMDCRQLLDNCAANNISVIAVTDHDSLPTDKMLKELNKNKGHQTKWIMGIEMSSGWPADLGGGATSGLHIVGLFVDPLNKALLEHCRKAKEARILRMKKMIKNLKGIGLKITEADCLLASNGESVGRPHIVKALDMHEENGMIYEKLILKMNKDAAKDEAIKRKYDNLLERGKDQYPFILFLSDDAYIPNIYVDYQYYLDLENTVKLIRNAGGLAILAHWFSCRSKITENYLGTLFEDNKLDGAEVVYGLFNYNTSAWTNQQKELQLIGSLVRKYSKAESGGADIHSLEDIEQFSKESWFAGKTAGMAEKIMGDFKIDKSLSSL